MKKNFGPAVSDPERKKKQENLDNVILKIYKILKFIQNTAIIHFRNFRIDWKIRSARTATQAEESKSNLCAGPHLKRRMRQSLPWAVPPGRGKRNRTHGSGSGTGSPARLLLHKSAILETHQGLPNPTIPLSYWFWCDGTGTFKVRVQIQLRNATKRIQIKKSESFIEEELFPIPVR